MSEKVWSKCGMRCDLCLIWRPNVEKEDRREAVCKLYVKMEPGFQCDPETIICDGCACMNEDATLLAPNCRARRCVIEKGLAHCGYCESYPCEIFPQEPSHEELVKIIEVEKRWTWEEEALLEAHNCKKFMDAFRKEHGIG